MGDVRAETARFRVELKDANAAAGDEAMDRNHTPPYVRTSSVPACEPAMAASRPRLAGVILAAAGVYQLTPFKSACLTQCRSPLGFLRASWRAGNMGALQMGARHGAYCLGCCWALMGVLFAVGVMNLVWVAALTALVLIEKVGPAGAAVGRVAGALMLAVGVLFVTDLL